MRKLRHRWLLALFGLAFASLLEAAPPAELPVATFFKKPALAQLTFSPDGKRIACLIPYERRMNLAVIDLEKKTKNLLTKFTDNDVGSLLWASNDRLVFTQDIDGQEVPSVMAVNADGSDPVKLFGYDSTSQSSAVNIKFRGLLRRLKHDARNILVLADLTGAQGPDVCQMNLKTGRISIHTPNPGFVQEWLLDHNDQVRGGVSSEGGKIKILLRDEEKDEWQTMANGSSGRAADEDSDDGLGGGWVPLAFDGDNRTLLVSGRFGRDRTAICRYDTKTHLLSEPIVADEVYDAADDNEEYNPYPLKGAIYDQAKQRIVGYAYRRDQAKVVWFEDDLARLQKQIDLSLPDTTNFIMAASPDDSRRLILAQSDRDPGVYYLFDQAKKSLEELAVIKPGIDPALMAPMKPITFAARDGLPLHAYLTLPLGRPAKNLPLVVHPHGGPYGLRDDWIFNSEVQFYANRGYAVLQVNYRGSGGYGAGFQKAGYQKWGLEMQNDLTDAVAWAVAEGIADRKRIVISGASYGGYATMAGLAFTPELYCAGINYVGVTNLTTHWGRYKGTSLQMRVVHRWFGDMDKAADRKRAYDTSPCNFADRIQAPVLMAYGKNDPRVKIDQGFDMEAALKKHDKAYEMIIEQDEGHGFRKEELSIAFYTKVDGFLRKYVVPDDRTPEAALGEMKVLELPARKP